MPIGYYIIELRPDREQGGYWATVPALPGIYSQGDTIEQAIENVEDAIKLYLDDLTADGEPIPEDSNDTPALVVRIAA